MEFLGAPREGRIYFSEVLISPNLVLRLPPMPLTAVIIANEIPAAIRPYSMAVAPDSSARNLKMIRFNPASSGRPGGAFDARTIGPQSVKPR